MKKLLVSPGLSLYVWFCVGVSSFTDTLQLPPDCCSFCSPAAAHTPALIYSPSTQCDSILSALKTKLFFLQVLWKTGIRLFLKFNTVYVLLQSLTKLNHKQLHFHWLFIIISRIVFIMLQLKDKKCPLYSLNEDVSAIKNLSGVMWGACDTLPLTSDLPTPGSL